MAKTIQQLKKELAEKERKLGKLQDKRDKLLKQVADVDDEIAKLGGEPGAAPAKGAGKKKKTTKKKARRKSAKKSAKKPARKAARRGGGRAKGKGGKTLADMIQEVLAKSDEPMRIKEIAAAVQDAGYKSDSKDFYGFVASTLRDKTKFARVSRGKYTVASKQSA